MPSTLLVRCHSELNLIVYSVSDPDPIRSGFSKVRGSRSRRAEMTDKTRKKLRIFMFWSAGYSLLMAEGFSCSLDVLYGGGLGIANDNESYDILAQP